MFCRLKFKCMSKLNEQLTRLIPMNNAAASRIFTKVMNKLWDAHSHLFEQFGAAEVEAIVYYQSLNIVSWGLADTDTDIAPYVAGWAQDVNRVFSI